MFNKNWEVFVDLNFCLFPGMGQRVPKRVQPQHVSHLSDAIGLPQAAGQPVEDKPFQEQSPEESDVEWVRN